MLYTMIMNIINVPTGIACIICTIGLDLSIITTLANFFSTEDKTTQEIETMFQLNSPAAKYFTWILVGLTVFAIGAVYLVDFKANRFESTVIQLCLSGLSCWYLYVLGKYHWDKRKADKKVTE